MHKVWSRTINFSRVSGEEIRHTRRSLRVLEGRHGPLPHLPATRAECLDGGSNAARPCPFVTCKWHLYLDVNATNGSIKFNFPDIDVWDMRESCALDIAEREGLEHKECGSMVNMNETRAHRLVQELVARLREMAAEEIERLEDYAK